MLNMQVDTSDVRLFVNRMTMEQPIAIRTFMIEAQPIIKNTMIETFMELGAGSNGFPELYLNHLIDKINSDPPIRLGYSDLLVDLNLLGTYEDYTMGFHRFAIGANNHRILLPYQGEELKNETDARTEYWEDNIVGTFWYEDTIEHRVMMWQNHNVAPEWWVLQNGSNAAPYVAPVPLTELISARLEILLAPLLEGLEQEAVNKADMGIGSSGRRYYNVRGPSGRFAKKR